MASTWEGKFWGVMEPSPATGRYSWPFRQMQVGDWFLVRKSDRNPEDVRNQVMVRGSQLGRRFGFQKHPADHPGMCKVWRKANWDIPRMRTEFDYDGLRALLREQYGLDADQLPWHQCMNPGDSFVNPADRCKRDERFAVRVMVGRDPFIVELLPKALVLNRIEASETLESWTAKQIDAALLD